MPGSVASPLTRRQALQLGALLCAAGNPVLANPTDAKAPLFISAASDADDRHWVVGFSVAGSDVTPRFRQALPERAHHIAINAQRDFYVVVARRPGTWLQLGSLPDGQLHASIDVPADRHLFGHGIFSADGNWFYTTESNFDDLTGDNGRVVVWTVQGSGNTAMLQRSHEYPTHGVGPHELLLHPDHDTLVIANGGIRTHPSRDRENLNIDTMLPSLAYIDRHTGNLLEQQFLPQEFHQASIRHIDINAVGIVAIAMQFEGEPWQEVPLVATHRRGEPLNLLHAPPDLQPQMKQYVGSIRFDLSGRFFAASCPKGNLLTFWDAESGALLHRARARDGCGVTATDAGFVFTTGTGRLGEVDLLAKNTTDFAEIPELERLFFDNHLSMAGA